MVRELDGRTAAAPVKTGASDPLDALVGRGVAAQASYAGFTQEKVDMIFKAAALAASRARIRLAKLAVAETGIGVVEDKVVKNHFASEYTYNKYKDLPTCGIIGRDEAGGLVKIAEPLGVLAGVVRTTNPTSTAIFKCLLALKTRNGIVLSPHPRAWSPRPIPRASRPSGSGGQHPRPGRRDRRYRDGRLLHHPLQDPRQRGDLRLGAVGHSA